MTSEKAGTFGTKVVLAAAAPAIIILGSIVYKIIDASCAMDTTLLFGSNGTGFSIAIFYVSALYVVALGCLFVAANRIRLAVRIPAFLVLGLLGYFPIVWSLLFALAPEQCVHIGF